MELKIGTKEDLPEVIKMAEKFYQNSPYANVVKFDTYKTNRGLKNVITNPQGLLLLMMNEDKPVGMIIAVATELLFSHTKMSTEIAWWVEPEYRGSRKSLELLSAYEYWAEHKQGCSIIQMVCLDNFDLSKLYERRGYTKAETMYMKVFQ